MKKFIFGNWKMNSIKKDIKEWKENFLKEIEKTDFGESEIAVFVPFTHIEYTKEILKNTGIEIGAQNMYFEEKGAFTGEVSPLHLIDIGVKKIIIGHSERRIIFKEDNEILAKKLKKAVELGFEPVFCIGETLEQREKRQTEQVLEIQIKEGFSLLNKKDISKLIIAYEPVWAIGTGKVATPEQAVSAHRFIINYIKENYGTGLPVLYGGSIKPENFDSLIKNKEISGGLIGGSSLKGEIFAKLVKIALKY